MMKKYLIVAFSLLLCVTAGAQRLGVREEVRADWNKSSGLDCLLDLSPKALTPVPKGYEAVYISHYGLGFVILYTGGGSKMLQYKIIKRDALEHPFRLFLIRFGVS